MSIKTLVRRILKARPGSQPNPNFRSVGGLGFNTETETKPLPVASVIVSLGVSPLRIVSKSQVSFEFHLL